jgi:hypothetical protein
MTGRKPPILTAFGLAAASRLSSSPSAYSTRRARTEPTVSVIAVVVTSRNRGVESTSRFRDVTPSELLDHETWAPALLSKVDVTERILSRASLLRGSLARCLGSGNSKRITIVSPARDTRQFT